jgi:hypothetical protein
MTYDVLYQMRGDEYAARVFRVVRTERAAWAAARKIVRQDGVMRVVISCEDGTELYDTRNDHTHRLFT